MAAIYGPPVLRPGEIRKLIAAPDGRSRVERIVSRYLKEIGRHELHGHSLRHSFGALVTKSTRSIYIAQRLLGHVSPTTTSRFYSVFETSDADAAADAISASIKNHKY